jgi:two-component system, CAI-1 autoinducer sensor kinase/phosphatase CqsS
VPIFLFALTAGTIFNYKAAGLRQAKERARLELGTLLAKEMQVPLVTLRTNAASLSKFLPHLLRAHPDADQQQKTASDSIARQLSALERVPARIEEAIEQMGNIIEVLVTEGGEVGAGRWRASSMLRCLDEAIARLPFAAELDRARIVIDRQYDFLFHGSPVLMRHILARVLEASLNEVYAETGAELVVTLGKAGNRNYLLLTDSSAELRGATSRLLSSLSRGDREFAKRPDLELANFVLGRIGGSVERTIARGRTGETVLWFAQPGS